MRTFQATIVWLSIPSELRAPPQKPLERVCCCLCAWHEGYGRGERGGEQGQAAQKKRIIFKSKPKNKKAKRGTNFLCEISENMKRHKYVKMHGEIAEDTHIHKQTHTYTDAQSHTLAQRLKDEGTYLYKRA